MDRVIDTSTEVPDRDPDRRWHDSHGYVWVAWNGVGRAREHRVVTKAAPGMHVHHINGVRDDNRPENLEVHTPSEHYAAHGESGTWRKLDDMSCVICGDLFRPKSSVSRTCRDPECVAEHHRQAAKLANEARWAGKTKMTPEQRQEAARESRRRYKQKQRQVSL